MFQLETLEPSQIIIRVAPPNKQTNAIRVGVVFAVGTSRTDNGGPLTPVADCRIPGWCGRCGGSKPRGGSRGARARGAGWDGGGGG